MTIIALIPSRSGSKRVPGKNTRTLAGHPLLAYAIATAYEADIFDAVAVSSDDPATLEIAEEYGANRLILRPEWMAQDWSPDITWVAHLLGQYPSFETFAILRPTSPFRRGSWVYRAWEAFQKSSADSLRAMRPSSEHPGKMWRCGEKVASPILPYWGGRGGWQADWHSLPTQELPSVWVQTAALEIGKRTAVFPPGERWQGEEPGTLYSGNIAGEIVFPWKCERDAPESIDINTESDWQRAEQMAAAHPEWLPQVVQRVIA
jgi:CMP-N,N'-diacetyllegionaminic acid synthase